jgi:hypothetical protein
MVFWMVLEGYSATFWATLSVVRSNGLDGEVDDRRPQGNESDGEEDVLDGVLHGANECGTIL